MTPSGAPAGKGRFGYCLTSPLCHSSVGRTAFRPDDHMRKHTTASVTISQRGWPRLLTAANSPVFRESAVPDCCLGRSNIHRQFRSRSLRRTLKMAGHELLGTARVPHFKLLQLRGSELSLAFPPVAICVTSGFRVFKAQGEGFRRCRTSGRPDRRCRPGGRRADSGRNGQCRIACCARSSHG